jgi:hypothetical protein
MARKAFVTCDSCETSLTLSTHPDDEQLDQLRQAKWYVLDTPTDTLELCSAGCLLTWATNHQPTRKQTKPGRGRTSPL